MDNLEIQNNTTPEPIASVPGEPIKIDLFETQMKTGLSLNRIVATLKDDDEILPLKTIDQYGEWADKFATKEDFQDFYNYTVNSYDQTKMAKMRNGISRSGSEMMGVGKGVDPNYGKHTLLSLNVNADMYSGANYEDPLKVETPSQNATRNGLAKSWDVNTKSWIEDEVPDFVERVFGNWYISPQKNDEGKPVLDLYGRPQYEYLKFNGDQHNYNLEKAAIYGDRKLYGSGIIAGIKSFASTASVELVQSGAQIAGLVVDAAGYAVAGDAWEQLQNIQGVPLADLNNFFDSAIDFTESLKYNAPQEYMESTFLGSGWAGFAFQLGTGLGYIAPQKGAVKALVGVAGKTVGKKALYATSISLGTSQAINAFYRAARQAGLSEKDASYLSIMALPAVALTEGFFNAKWLTKGLGQNSEKLVAAYYKKSVKDLISAGIDPSSSKGLMLTTKKVFNEMVFDKGFRNTIQSIPVIGPAGSEAMQESSEELIYGALETAYDNDMQFFGKDLTAFGHSISEVFDPGSIVGEGRFGTEIISHKFGERLKQNAIGGFIVGGVMGATMLGAKEQHRDNIFDEMVARGKTNKLLKYLTKAHKNGIMGPTHQDINENVMFRGADGEMVGESVEVEEDLIINGKTYFSKGDKLQTANDLNFYNTILDISIKDNVAKKYGINDGATLSTFTGHEQILKGALKTVLAIEDINTQLLQLNQALTSEGITEEKAAEITKQIEDLEIKRDGIVTKDKDGNDVVEKKGLKQQWEYYMSPVTVEGKSQAYVDDSKHALYNGYVNDENGNIKKEVNKLPFLNKSMTRMFDENFLKLLQARNNRKTKNREKILKDQQKRIEDLKLGVNKIIEEGTSMPIDATTINHSIDQLLKGIHEDLISDEVSNNIKDLAFKFSGLVESLFKEEGIDYDSSVEFDQRLLMVGKDESLSEDQQRHFSSLEASANAFQRLTTLKEDINPELVLKKDVLSVEEDFNFMQDMIYSYQREDKNIVSSKEIVAELKERAKSALDDADINDLLDDVSKALFGTREMLNWARFNNNLRKDKKTADLVSREKPTSFTDGKNKTSVLPKNPIDPKEDKGKKKSFTEVYNTKGLQSDPGQDIPEDYIDFFEDEYNEIEADYFALKAQAEKDGESSSLAERRRRIATITKVHKMLNRIFNDATKELSSIANKLNTSNELFDTLMEDVSKISEDQLSDIEKLYADIETDIYLWVQQDYGKNHKHLAELVLLSGSSYEHNDEQDSNFINVQNIEPGASSTLKPRSETTDDEIIRSISEGKYRAIFSTELTNYLNNIIAYPSNNFAKLLKTITNPVSKKNDNKNPKIPGVEQIGAIRAIISVGIGNLINPNYKFLVKSTAAKAEIIDYQAEPGTMGIKKHNAVHIDGSGGTGKTTVITKTALSIIDNILEEHKMELNSVLVAPNNDLLKVLEESLEGLNNISKGANANVSDFMKNPTNRIFDKETLLIIDESSTLSVKEIQDLINSIKEAGKKVRIVFLGDSSQAQALHQGNLHSKLPAMEVGMRIPKISMKFRSGIASIGIVQDVIASTMKGFATDTKILFPSVHYNAAHTKGVRYAINKREVIDQWKADVVGSESNRVLIFGTEREYNAFIKNDLSKSKVLLAYKDRVKFIMPNKDSKTPEAGMQGLEADYVYAAVEDLGSNVKDLLYNRKIFLTAESRAKKFVMLPVYEDQVKKSKLVEDKVIVDYSAENTETVNKRAVDGKTRIDKLATGVKTVDTKPKTKNEINAKPPREPEPVKKKTSKKTEPKKEIPKDKPTVIDPDDSKTTSVEMDKVAAAEEEIEDLNDLENKEDRSKKYFRSALEYNANRNFPIMVNVSMASDTDKPMSVNTFFRNKRNRTNLYGDHTLKYFKKVKLYTIKGDLYVPEEHHNVIAIIGADGAIVGVLPMPDTDFSDRKNRNKLFGSVAGFDFSEESFEQNSKQIDFADDQYKIELDNYHKALLRLYTDAYEIGRGTSDESIEIGSFDINKASGGKAIFGDTERSLSTLFTQAEAEGFLFVGGQTSPRVIQVRNLSTGYLETFLEGSYLETADTYPVPIHVMPRLLNDEDIKIIKNSVNTLNAYKGAFDFMAALNQSTAFQTILSNTSKFLTPNGNIKDEYKAFLELDNGRIDIIGIGEISDVDVYDNLVGAIKMMLEDNITAKSLRKWVPSSSIGEKEVITDISSMTTKVEQINSPQYSGKITIDKTHTKPAKNRTQEELNNDLNIDYLLEIHDNSPNLVDKSEGIAYLNTVLGKEYVSEFLSLTANPEKEDQRMWGYVDGLKMVLRVSGDYLNEKAFRHEPVHVIIDNLINSKKRRALLDAAKADLLNRKNNLKEISDSAAEEHIAYMHMNQEKTKGKKRKGILGRFLNFLGKFFDNLKTYDMLLNDFFKKVDSGFYANRVGKGSRMSENARQTMYLVDSQSTKIKNQQKKYNDLIYRFGDQDTLEKATSLVKSRVKEFSGMTGRIDMNISGIDAAFPKVAQWFADIARNEDLAKKFAGTKSMTLYENKSYGEKQKEIMFLISVLADKNVFNIIARHAFSKNTSIDDATMEVLNKGFRESSTIDPEFFVSDVIGNYLHSIKYYKYNNAGRKADTTNTFVNYDLLKTIIIEAMTTTRSFGNNDITSLFEELRKMANEYNEKDSDHYDNESRNVILSFLEEFGKKVQARTIKKILSERMSIISDPLADQPVFSYYMLAVHSDQILAATSDPEVKKLIRVKAKMANEILNGMMTNMNMRKVNSVSFIIKKTSGGEVLERNIFREDNLSRMINTIKSNMNFKFMVGLDYRKNVPGLVNGKGPGIVVYNVEAQSISRKNGDEILTYDEAGNFHFADPNAANVQKDIQALGLFFNLKIHGSTWRNISTNKIIFDKFGINEDMLANYFGHMLQAIRYDPQIISSNDFNFGDVQKNLEKFATKNKFLLKTPLGLNQDTGDYTTLSLDDFHPFIEKLAKIQTYIATKVSPGFTKTVHGNNKPNTTLASLLNHTFAGLEGGFASDKIVTYLKDNVLSSIYSDVEKSNSTPWVYRGLGEDHYTDPLLKGMVIDSIDDFGGLSSEWSAAEINEFVGADYYNAAINGFFKNSLFNTRSNQVLDILPDNLGDSSTLPVFGMRFSNRHENLVNAKQIEGRWTVTLNDKLINEHIDTGFKYARKEMLISLNKWYNYYTSHNQSFSKTIKQDELIEGNENNLIAIRKEVSKMLRGDTAPLANKIALLQAGGLMEIKDYIITSTGDIIVGKATNMNHDIFSETAYNQWQEANTVKRKAKLRDYLFRNRFTNLMNDIKTYEVAMPSEVEEAGSEIRSDKKSGYKYHPFYAGFMYAHFITNNSISNFTIGNDNQFKNAQEKSKRNKVLNSSGQKPTIGGTYNLAAETNVITVADEVIVNEIMKSLGESSNIIATDGLQLILPIIRNQLTTSLGGVSALSRFSDNTVKAIHTGKDWLGNNTDQNKFAQLVLNENLVKDTEFGEGLLKFMLSSGNPESDIDLYAIYQKYRTDGLSYDNAMSALTDYIGENNLHNEVVGIISFASTNKSNYGYVNNMSLSDLKPGAKPVIHKRNNDGLFFQLNLNHPLNLDVSRGNQLEAEVGVPLSNVIRAKVIDTVNSESLDRKDAEISDEISKTQVHGDENKIKVYMRDLANKNVNKMGTVNNISDLFANKSVDSSFPILMHQEIQSYVSEYNTGINPRTVGSKMIQMPAFFELYEQTDDEGNIEHVTKSEASKGSKNVGRLRHYRLLDKSGADITKNMMDSYDGNYHNDLKLYNEAFARMKELRLLTAYSKSQENEIAKYDAVLAKDGIAGKLITFRKKIKSEIDFVTPSQIAMAFPYRTEFNLQDGETVKDALSIMSGKKRINIRSVLKKELGEKGYYDRNTRQKAIDTTIRQLVENIKSENEGFTHRSLVSTDAILDYFKSLTDALNVVYLRTPTSLLSSAAYAEIVMFTEGSDNTVYISPEKNIFDGSDFDIDELSVLMKDVYVDESEIPWIDLPENTIESLPKDFTADDLKALFEKESWSDEALNNLKHEMLYRTYYDINNLNYITSSVDIQTLRDKVAKKQADNKYVHNSDFATSAYNFLGSQEGKNMVSRFANAIVALSRMTKVKHVRPDLLPTFTLEASNENVDLIAERTNFVLTHMARMLQASVDNAKEMILGFLNINRASGNIVSALVMSGFSEDAIVNFLNEPVIADVIKKVYEGYSVSKPTKKLIDVLNKKIRDINSLYVEQPLELSVQNRENRIKYYIQKLINERDSDFTVTTSIGEEAQYSDETGILSEIIPELLKEQDQDILDAYQKDSDETANIKAKEDWDKKLNKKIDKEAKKLANDNEFIKLQEEASREKAAKNIELLNEMRSAYYKGEFIWRLSQGFSLYKGLPVKEFDRYRATNNIEFNLGSTLEEYSNDNLVGDRWEKRGDNLAGVDQAGIEFTTREDVDGYVQEFVDVLAYKIPPGSMTIIVGNSDGFESVFVDKLKAAGYEVTVTGTENGSIINEYGTKVYPNTEGVIPVEGVGTDYKVKESNAKFADYTINFDVSENKKDQISVGNTNNVIPSKEDGIGILIDSISNQARPYRNGKVPFKLNLTGSTMYRIRTQDKSDYARFMEDEFEIRKHGNIAAIYKEIPNIDSYIKTLNIVNKDVTLFYRHSEFIAGLKNNLLETQRLNYLSNKQHVDFNNAVDEFIIDMYFNKSGPVFDLSTDKEKLITAGEKLNKDIDLSKYEDRVYFMAEFPQLILNIQNNFNHKLNTKDKITKAGNLFLEALSFNNNRLHFDQTFNDNNTLFKQEFHKIEAYDSTLADMFRVYNLLAYGFNFSNGSYRSVMGSHFYEDISNFISSVETDMKKRGHNEVKDAFNENFMDNAILTYDSLQPTRSTQFGGTEYIGIFERKALSGINPKFSKRKEHNYYIDRFGKRQNTTSYMQSYRYLGNGEYEEIYTNSTRIIKDIPSNRRIESRNEVITLVDVENYRDLRSIKNKTTEKTSHMKHGYEEGEVLVMGKRAKLTFGKNDRQIRLTLIDENPDYDYKSQKRDRAFERSADVFLNVINDYLDVDLIPNRSFTRLADRVGENIEYNARGMRINHSRIKDLGVINAAVLEKFDNERFIEIVEIGNAIAEYENYGNYEKVAELLLRDDIIYNAENSEILEDTRQQIADTYVWLLADTVSTASFDMKISDIFKENKDGIKKKHGSVFIDAINQAQLQKESEMDMLSEEAALAIADRLETQFGIKSAVVAESEARIILNLSTYENVPSGFFINNQAYLVRGKIHTDTPFHEVIHPFIDAIEKENPGLFNSLINELDTTEIGRKALKRVKYMYPEIDDASQRKEALVQLLGEGAARIIPVSNKGLLSKIRSFWNWVGSRLKNIFPSVKFPSRLNPNITISQLSKMISRGDKFFIAGINDKIYLQKTTNLQVSDLDNDLLILDDLKPTSVDFNKKNDEATVEKVYKDILLDEDNQYTLKGKIDVIVDFTEELEKGDSYVKEKIREKILPGMAENLIARQDMFVAWLNNTDPITNGFGKMDLRTLRKFFSSGKSKRLIYDYETLAKVKQLVGHNPGMKLMRYSQLNDYFSGSKLEGMFDEAFKDNDPLIIVHRSIEEDGVIQSADISIIDLGFKTSKISVNPGLNLFTNYLTEEAADDIGIRLGNNVSALKKFKLGLIAAKIKSAGGDNIHIRKAGAVNVFKAGYEAHLIDMVQMVDMLSKIKDIEPFMDALDINISSILANEEVMNTDNYQINYLTMMRNIIIDDQTYYDAKYGVDNKKSGVLEKDLSIIDQYINGVGSELELENMLKYRRSMLDNFLGSYNKKKINEEYWIISEILGNMKGYKPNSIKNKPILAKRDAGFWEEWAKAIHDMRSEVLQDIYAVMRRTSKEITGVYDLEYKDQFRENLKPVTDKWIERKGAVSKLKEIAIDLGEERFERLWIKKDVVGTDNKQYTINTFEIHTSMTPEARAAGLSKEEVEFGSYIADEVEKYMKMMIRHELSKRHQYYIYNDEGYRVLDKNKVEKQVNYEYNKNWKRGMMPIMEKSASENIASGKIGAAGRKFVRRMGNPVEEFDEVLEMTAEAGSDQNVRSHFLNQYYSDSITEYGGSRRMKMLGFDISTNGTSLRILKNKNIDGFESNQGLTGNIEQIMDFFVMDVLWKTGMEEKVIPEYVSAKVRLDGIVTLYGISQDANKRHLNVMFDKIVQGKYQLEHESKEWRNIATGLNIVYKMTTFNGVALSVPVAITSGVGNLTELSLHAFANSIANPTDTFTWPEVMKGQVEMLKNPKLIEKLTKMYQITENERFDILSNQRFKETKNFFLNSRMMHIMNWITDYHVRQLVMVSQMIHDGSWAAHTLNVNGEVVYDAKKDRRFYKEDGTYANNNIKGAKSKWVAENLARDPRVKNQDPKSDPVRGYDIEDQGKFEWIASTFVTGTYNKESTGKFDSYIGAKLIAQFKKFLISKVELRVAGKVTKKEGGWKVVYEDENGKIHRLWQDLETEGAYRTAFNYIYNDILTPLVTGNYRGIKGFSDMSELEKYNLARTAMDGVVFAALYLLFTGLKGAFLDDDDELPKSISALYDMRLIKALQNGFLTALAITPGQMISTLSIPVIDQAIRLINMATFNGTSTDLKRSLPLGATIDSYQDLVDYTSINY